MPEDLPEHKETRELGPDDIGGRLRRVINTHGFAFQARVLKACHGRNVIEGPLVAGRWLVRTDEFPASLHRETEFHIDGILEYQPHFQSIGTRLVAVECKRVDPSLKEWCFARLAGQADSVITTVTLLESGHEHVPAHLAVGQPIAQLGLELKTRDQGNGIGKSLNTAVDQAFRGAHALVDQVPIWFTSKSGYPIRVCVFPLIVTTAHLFMADQLLEDSDIATGEVGQITVRPVLALWLSVQLNQSLLPKTWKYRRPSGVDDPVGWAVQQNHQRAVMIANVEGLPIALQALGVADPRPIVAS